MTGVSAGLTLLYDGGNGMFGGSRRAAAAMAACTSCAAASRSRERLNWRVMDVEPREEADVMESRPEMVENWRSSGVATEAAIVSGLAPGRPAETWMVGKSTVGRSLPGSWRYAMMQNKTMASMTSVVMTGRRMKMEEMFIANPVVSYRLSVGGAAVVSTDNRQLTTDNSSHFTSTLLFGVSRSWPSVTTVSPAVTPWSMTTCWSPAWETVTGRISTPLSCFTT